jgi:hypothetical protein
MSFQGKKNIYVCQKCGHGFVSIDIDEGVTPFMTGCLRVGCAGWAQSLLYRADPMLKDIPAALEWYRPATLDVLKHSVQVHVEKGGLISRPTMVGQ